MNPNLTLQPSTVVMHRSSITLRLSVKKSEDVMEVGNRIEKGNTDSIIIIIIRFII